MSRRKHQRSLEQRYGAFVTPWMAPVLGLCAILMLAIYLGTMPL